LVYSIGFSESASQGNKIYKMAFIPRFYVLEKKEAFPKNRWQNTALLEWEAQKRK